MEALLDNMRTLYLSASAVITWQFVLTYGGITLGAYLIYHLFLHQFVSPLSKVPGLKFVPLLGNLRYIMQGEAMETSIEMMREFGGVVRYYFFLGRERLMIADPEVMKHVFVNNSKNYIKPPGRLGVLRLVLGEGLVTSEGATHSVHKRLMSPSFNQNSIKKMLPVFAKMADLLRAHWADLIGDGDGVEISVHQDLTRTTLDIIGKTAFGYDFNALKTPDLDVNQRFQKLLSGSGLNWRFMVPFYFHLPFPDVKEYKYSLGVIFRTVERIIGKKRNLIQQGEDLDAITSDCLGMMMMARDESTGRGMSDRELRDQVMTLMLAGHETTAVGMAWCLLALAQNLEIQTRAREEILSVFPTLDTEMTWERLDQLEYCHCVVKETLRMYPPVPLTLRQAVQADVFKRQHYIPKNTILLMAMGPMMRSEKLFDDPDTFRPERFFEKQASETMYHFLPFLIGTRMCLGYKFAQLEMKALLVMLLRRLEFQPIEGQHYRRKLLTTMRPDPPLRLRVSQVKT